MSGLSLGDLGLDVAPDLPHLSLVPQAPPVEPGRVTLRDVALEDHEQRFSSLLADLGVREAAACLARAVDQTWGRRPDLMPVSASLMTAPTEDVGPVDTLADLLRLAFPERVAARILVLAWRHGQDFLSRHVAWSGDLADEGVGYEEMYRRASLGEFDLTGPLASTFDLETMKFPIGTV